jgi:hypothetical protein
MRREAARTGLLVLFSIAALAAAPAAWAGDWWMLQKTDEGSQCGPPLEADGVVLTPEELMQRFPECKLLPDTPSLDLDSIFLNCEGNIGQVFIFTKTKEGCEKVAKDIDGQGQ